VCVRCIAREVIEYSNHHYPNCWISNFGPQVWPVRSPDLMPLDYIMLGWHMKDMACGHGHRQETCCCKSLSLFLSLRAKAPMHLRCIDCKYLHVRDKHRNACFFKVLNIFHQNIRGLRSKSDKFI